ncbi:34953_t:CDS:2, partial [Racocetra persica]
YKAGYTLLGLIWLGLLTYTTSTPLSPAPNQHLDITPRDPRKRYKKHRPFKNFYKNDSQPVDTSSPSTINIPKSNPTDLSIHPTGASSGTKPTGTSSSTGTLSALPKSTNRPANLASVGTLSPGIFQPFLPLEKTNGPVTRKYTFTCKRTQLAPDGFSRVVWAVNGQYPGPIIRANKGDKMEVTVINELEDPTAIHMHGIFMRNSTWFDGVPGLSQCPQISGTKFTYSFDVDQYGTYWYHSHFVAQYVDGMKGPIIIHDPDDPYLKSYDYEYVMTVSDWYHDPTGNFMPTFRSVKYRGADPVPDSGEISGVGRYDCSKAPGGSSCKDNGYAIYKVQRGKKYRFRIINTSAMAHFTVSIDNHPMTIIEVEGTNVKEHTVEYLPINIAERYSVIINCNQTVGNFWIKAIMARCSIPYRPGDPGTINSNSAINYTVLGILRYEGAPETNPQSTGFSIPPPNCYDQDPNTLKPYKPEPPPSGDVDTIGFTVNVGLLPVTGLLAATVNGKAFVPDFSYPTVKRLRDGMDPSRFLDTDNAYGFNISSGSPVEILIRNVENRTHPFHLHGHAFWVVCTGEPGSNTGDRSSLNCNYDDPPLRDIVTVKPRSLTAIRYIADNPGVWAFHCHIEWHVEMGMVAQLIESPDLLGQQLRNMPEEVSHLCDQFDNTNGLSHDPSMENE